MAEARMTNCTECTAHRVLPDPDPNDWFNDDDVKVVCTANNNKVITCACRPYRIKKECDIPNWCPKVDQEEVRIVSKPF